MLVVGLTGGISSGKSTVLKTFGRLGLRTLDADEIAHKLTEPGTRVLEEIVRNFGKEVLSEGGALNRKRLADMIFASEKKRKVLNRITHPEIIAEIRREVREVQMLTKRSRERGGVKSILVIDIPLLFEAKLESLVDKIVLVYVPRKIQIERLRRDHNLTLKETMARIGAQIPLYKKKKYADFIIDGDLNFNNLKKKVGFIYKELQKIVSKYDC